MLLRFRAYHIGADVEVWVLELGGGGGEGVVFVVRAQRFRASGFSAAKIVTRNVLLGIYIQGMIEQKP